MLFKDSRLLTAPVVKICKKGDEELQKIGVELNDRFTTDAIVG
jgi:hypothetical protein